MTICLSYIYRGKEIIGFCDSLGYRNDVLTKDHEKFVYLEDRKLLFLFSGYDAPIDKFKEGIRANSERFSPNHDVPTGAGVALKLFKEYCVDSYENENLRCSWKVLLCGIYEDTPQIVTFDSDEFICTTENKVVIIGSSKIVQILKKILKKYTFDFDDLEKSQAIEKLGNIIKEAMIEENALNKESPQTGGQIRRLILSPDGLECRESIPFSGDR